MMTAYSCAELIGKDDVCELDTGADAFMEKMLKRQSDVKGIATGNIAKVRAKQKSELW